MDNKKMGGSPEEAIIKTAGEVSGEMGEVEHELQEAEYKEFSAKLDKDMSEMLTEIEEICKFEASQPVETPAK